MHPSSLTLQQRRNKKIYGIAFICFAVITITDLIASPADLLKLTGSLALAAGWLMLFLFYPFITAKRKYAIVAAFIASLALLIIRIMVRGH